MMRQMSLYLIVRLLDYKYAASLIDKSDQLIFQMRQVIFFKGNKSQQYICFFL
jgi:hypothetical protein